MLASLAQRFDQLHPDRFTVAAIVAAFAGAGVFIGYVIATGRTVPIALALGAIAGIALLNALPLVIWTILIGVLLISGPLFMFVPELEKANWLFSLLGFFLTGAAILYAAVGRQRFTHPPPPFVVLVALLFALGLLSLLYSGGPFMEWVRAGKRYFQFLGLLFILAVVPFPPALVKRWWTFLIALALAQLPFAVYQRVILVPTLEGRPGVIPIDIVVGTMEGSLLGGGSSAVMALLLVFVLAYLVCALREGILPLRTFLLLALLVGAPLPLGEVTLLVILLPLALGAVFVDLLARRPGLVALGLVLAVPIAALAGWTYLLINAQPGQSIESSIEAVIAYNFGDTSYYGHGLNRTSIYTYWFENHGLADPVRTVFGHGLGSSFGGISEPDPGHMEHAHNRVFIGLTAASSILWDLGLLGAGMYLAIFVMAAREAGRLVKTAQPGFDRAFCRALMAMAVMLTVMPFYSNAAISVPTQQVLTALTLGLIAWRRRSAPHLRAAADARRGR